MGVVKRFYPTNLRELKYYFRAGILKSRKGELMAVHQLFNPLAGAENPIYREKAVICIDKPNETQLKKYEMFKAGYHTYFKTSKSLNFPRRHLRNFIHNLFAKKRGEISNEQKVTYAREVANKIQKINSKRKCRYFMRH